MEKIKKFLGRKDVVPSMQRYGIDALGAMAQGLFCTLLVGTILNTIGQQFAIGFLNRIIVTIGTGEGAVGYTIGGLASAMVGPGIAVAIGFALCIEHDAGYYQCPHCGKAYVPTKRAVVLAPHLGRSRKMRCPYCGQKGYHKKVLTR